MKIPFLTSRLSGAGGSNPSTFPLAQLQNLYPAMEGEERALIRPGPGFIQIAGTQEWTDRGSAAIRGLFSFPGAGGGDLYSVCGTAFERIDSSKVATSMGTVSGTDPVIFDMIRDTVILSANGNAYYTTGVSSTQIVDADLGTVTSVAGLDGRLLASRSGSDTFVWSEVFDPGNIDSLSFATAETYGDNLQRVITNESGLVYLFGERSTEVWQRTGVSTAPFARIGSMVYPYGCPARHSIAKHGNRIFFVGVSMTDGAPFVGMLTPQFEIISDPQIEYKLRYATTHAQGVISNIRGFAYRQNGATFYQMDLTNSGLTASAGTWTYHVESRTWFERKKGTDSSWHSACMAEAFGLHLVGSKSADGKIWEMSPGVYTDATDSLIRVATAFIPVERPTPITTLLVDSSSEGTTDHTATVEISQDGGVSYRTSRSVPLEEAASGARRAAPSFCWGTLRRPGGLVRVTISANLKIALYNLIVNEMST